jgi:hypothetical protein
MQTEGVTTTGEQDAPRAPWVLSALAILLFVFFVLSRGQTWAQMSIVPILQSTPSEQVIKHTTDIAGTQWGGLSYPLYLFGFALIGANLLAMLMPHSIDRLVPVIANLLIGGVLAVLTIYFMARTDDILGGHATRNLLFKYEPATGATAALLIALMIMGCGVAQLALRNRDLAESA